MPGRLYRREPEKRALMKKTEQLGMIKELALALLDEVESLAETEDPSLRPRLRGAVPARDAAVTRAGAAVRGHCP
jgi:hypothetical protein